MIGADLPPGTEVECIDDDVNSHLLPDRRYAKNDFGGLTANGRYTVRDYVPALDRDDVNVRLVEIVRKALPGQHECGFNRARFRAVKLLPASLMACLNVRERAR